MRISSSEREGMGYAAPFAAPLVILGLSGIGVRYGARRSMRVARSRGAIPQKTRAVRKGDERRAVP